MAAISLLVDLWRRNPSFSTRTFHYSRDILSPSFAVSATLAAATVSSFASGKPGISSFSFCDSGLEAPYSDAGADLADVYLSKLRSVSGNLVRNDILKYSAKIYPLELKPLFSAFYPGAFASTTVRSFIIYYLPLLEPPQYREYDDDLPEVIADRDLVTPFYKSLKRLAYEVTVTTTRRILERIAANKVSQRTAWKLIKDVPKSARRKAGRGMSSSKYAYSMCRTKFRGHVLAAAASWLVQVGIVIYRCFSHSPELEDQVIAARLKLLTCSVFWVTMRCSAALAFASIGAAIGSTIIHPSLGAIIGCAFGEAAGPVFVMYVGARYFDVNFQLTD
ncbi:hypothetical protein ACHQM5_006663 [Ranunculus cassubicifolius]